ncbi:hypothetical protein LOTGIDRAFT_171905 [Lottia gigantea]|uniref:Receptor ligand binding region domain-containing protein n=1 Tax=Lottia gigantea TaxID=225164 RepID=V4CK32_LOTGI|nr:hypothetical protein LOTGIDRAFT_171905 [Lottia gigantea]ESP02585.1 hypothetical protein LOTGIDRAFT_171905 [Lottia gigantea]
MWNYYCLSIVLVYINHSVSKRYDVNIAAILPQHDARMFSIHNVQPVLRYTTDKIKSTLLPTVDISVNYANSRCTSKDAPIAAFNFYMKNEVNVFFGPVCDYSLAPVARYAPFWNIPVISPGGLAHDFGANKRLPDAEYPSLTRVGVTFNSLAMCMIDMVQEFQWKQVKVIYDGNGHGDVTPRFCFLAAAAFVAYSKNFKLKYDFHIYIPSNHDIEEMLVEKIGNDYGELMNRSNYQN